MTQRERESLAHGQTGDADPHSLLFGDDDDSFDGPPPKLTRADRRHTEHASRRRRSRRGRWFVLLALVIVAAVGVIVVPRVVDYFSVADYSGTGTGSVSVTIPTGATAKDIGNILHDRGVVKSAEAFTDAASDDSKSESIQPGTYTLRERMSGTSALNLLLDPSARDTKNDVLVPEGATSLDVMTKLSALYGSSRDAQIAKALHSSADLSVPVSYRVGSKFPVSAEGFLFPATYTFDPSMSPTDALTTMVLRFVRQDRETNFATDAKKVGLTPYQALIVASIAQSEAKYAADMPKVAEVIANRRKAHLPLQIDATTKYGCELRNVALAKCNFSTFPSVYNSYLNAGLPPTPIDNPGAAAMYAAVHPAKGALRYYVNGDKAGHLFFTASPTQFEKARVKCVKNNWGCG